MMRGLSILQPWATLIASGAKRIETRSWRTHYRGRLVIYAGRRFTSAQSALVFSPEIHPLLKAAGITSTSPLPFGGPIAVVNLDRCREIIGGEGPPMMVDWDVFTDPVPKSEIPLGDFSDRRFAWVLSAPRRLDVNSFRGLDVRGRQGLFLPPSDVVGAIEEQLDADNGED